MSHSDDEHTSRLFYRAYLVRLWQETQESPCRASAQSVQSGETVRFSSLGGLYAFLDAQVADDRRSRTEDDASAEH
ncbi:MAG: hypothetical protein KF753_02475 [Caldilineaceae bacterium]|nr:hypothetical protein [Caldilineaceae bacterium]